jgi:hypothetical protein
MTRERLLLPLFTELPVRDRLKILYWSQTKAYEGVKRSAEVSFLLFDGTKMFRSDAL